jgi:hypothetical protein
MRFIAAHLSVADVTKIKVADNGSAKTMAEIDGGWIIF